MNSDQDINKSSSFSKQNKSTPEIGAVFLKQKTFFIIGSLCPKNKIF